MKNVLENIPAKRALAVVGLAALSATTFAAEFETTAIVKAITDTTTVIVAIGGAILGVGALVFAVRSVQGLLSRGA